MGALDAAQIDRDLLLEPGIDRLAETMPQQHVFGGNGGVGFELEHPMAFGLLVRQQRVGRGLNALVEFLIGHCISRISAARCPERIAPSMVAGSPVSVQSPARMRLRQRVFAPGRLASCAGVAAKVARRSRTICQGGILPSGSVAGRPVTLATSSQMIFASSSRGVLSNRSPALMVIETRPVKLKIHSTVPLITPRIGGAPAGGSIRKCALTMARNSFGTSRPSTSDAAV